MGCTSLEGTACHCEACSSWYAVFVTMSLAVDVPPPIVRCTIVVSLVCLWGCYPGHIGCAEQPEGGSHDMYLREVSCHNWWVYAHLLI
jgi:hypothetical protein